MSQVLIRPLITEKTSADSEANNRFGFVVAKSANKIQIKRAVETKYNVDVTAVRTINVDGKKRSRYTKTGIVNGRSRSYKKAIISVAEGQTIDLYDNI
ncbi:MAG: 50S ribosomal protein L23 [Bacteroidota bacterium]